MELGIYTFVDRTPDPVTGHTISAAQAADEFFPAYADVMTRLGEERGWPPMTRQQYDALLSPRGALIVGSPRQVIDKILFQHEVFGHHRFLAQLSVGTMPHDRILRAIELFGTEVAPVVRKEIESRAGSVTSPVR
ncbi:MAG TPA: hypothetical protein VF789_29805 [Thermoanaerobaculia bacterium]